MDVTQKDYFSDLSIVSDPHPYFDAIRALSPVWREPHYGVFMVTGAAEVTEVLTRNDGTFSSAMSVLGPIPPLPFAVNGGDISAEIEQHRGDMPWSAHITTFDGRKHAEHRSLLSPLLTYKRLKANEEYLVGLADRVLDGFIEGGKCNAASQYAHAVATFAISDLMGIPEADRWELVELLGVPPSQIEGEAVHRVGSDPLIFLKERFDGYLRERQENPCADLMSELVASRYKDGRQPDFETISNLARFMFGAGQDTTSRLVTMALRALGDDQELQARIRAEPSRIPDLLEEALRWDGPVKVVYRLATHDTHIGGTAIPAGSLVGATLSAASNDPARFADPRNFDIDREHLRDHFAFSRGAHACLGAPLARIEARVAIERILSRTSSIRISEEHHGPAGARRYRYEPTYSFRSMSDLHIEFEPVSADARKPSIIASVPS
ncbi:cytochrome P450 [Novosphingobium sp. TH158]|uniref:cytochrome P450 n=1 Tax=Novosphingobium sp. TH158 TaxID=2067455 RepID=UPI000C7C0245|nr:cytochrome P450 [Novosphingobium sp. TH158]PLK26722.1 cytochrome P450 [Novosphingobium sp. TH158]